MLQSALLPGCARRSRFMAVMLVFLVLLSNGSCQATVEQPDRWNAVTPVVRSLKPTPTEEIVMIQAREEIMATTLPTATPGTNEAISTPDAAQNLYREIPSENLSVNQMPIPNRNLYVAYQASQGRQRLYGYIDEQGQFFIPAQYTCAQPFHDGLALVRPVSPELPDSCAYLDRAGQVAFQIEKCAAAGPFSDELAWVRLDWDAFYDGYIDTTGQMAITGQYTWVGDFSEGFAPVAQGEAGAAFGYIDRQGTVVVEPGYQKAGAFSEGLAAVTLFPEPGTSPDVDGLCGYIDASGRPAIQPQFASCGPFREGLAAVSRPFYKDPLVRLGYIRPDGQFVIAARYHDARDFSEGLAAVAVKNDATQIIKWGYINSWGTFTIPARYDLAQDFSEDLAFVAVNGLYGLIDKRGAFIVRPQYVAAQPFENGLALVIRMEAETGATGWEYIDKSGNVIWKGTW